MIPATSSESFSRVPVNQHLGFELRRSSEGEAELGMPLQPWFRQEGGVIQGGIVTALSDTAAVQAVYPFLDAGETMTTIELKINFLRPGRMDGGPLIARSKTIKRGGTITLCEVEVFQDGLLLAKGLFTHLMMRRK